MAEYGLILALVAVVVIGHFNYFRRIEGKLESNRVLMLESKS